MKFNERRESELQINLTPLIDVVFLLLIFFMVSTTFSRESHLRIKLPEASQSEEKEKEDKVLEITISAVGSYSVRTPGSDKVQPLISDAREVLQRAIAAATGGDDRFIILVRADRKTPHEAVIRAMDASRRLGHTRITFATQRPSSANTTP